MTKQLLNEAYEFFVEADKDLTLAKSCKKESPVIDRIRNYMIGKDDLSFLLHDSDTAFYDFRKSGYVGTDLTSAIRTLRYELNKL